MTYGINEVTKKLETQIHNFHLLQVVDVPEPSLPLKYVFVCRSDVDPPLLIDHLPHLVAAYNSNCLRDPIKLVTLPQGAELLLAQNLGIRRVTVIAIDTNYNDQHLASMLESVPTLTASWLSQPNASTSLIPTHIKHVRTTAPRDMKAAKDLRVQQKLDAKKKKLQNDAGARG
ncbi:hypothetical protein JR316_0000562 [Psilocybe cubensis]|nr:hypothetical protein JR316_0000562 [Psilocybe cubensis]KAH9486497.1 hypothetical protein JR316_0000562 [Psilocybe cubensis]